MRWYSKARRAQNNQDFETWVEGGVVPTLNAFDNGDIRSTTIIFYGNRVDDIRIQGDVINTLQARMGTGGNNMPMILRRREGKPGGGKGPLLSNDRSLGLSGVNDQTLFTDEGIVRRLTPMECERLQGFPDGWTDSQPLTQRYKQMGNAVTVPVAEWIFRRVSDTIDL
jgi:DNA (cytosine-5)-methyltransferase 1